MRIFWEFGAPPVPPPLPEIEQHFKSKGGGECIEKIIDNSPFYKGGHNLRFPGGGGGLLINFPDKGKTTPTSPISRHWFYQIYQILFIWVTKRHFFPLGFRHSINKACLVFIFRKLNIMRSGIFRGNSVKANP